MDVFRQLGTSRSTESSGNGILTPERLRGSHVVRNETVDATHLCEFHQVEGVIADYGLTLGGLMEFMEIFFNAMGVTDLRFKPA
jgi:phenylalanyl-tRNA synthetase alpha chain